MTCSFSGRRKRPRRRAFVVLCAIRARPEDLISLTGLLPIWLPEGALPAGVTVSWRGQIRCDPAQTPPQAQRHIIGWQLRNGRRSKIKLRDQNMALTCGNVGDTGIEPVTSSV
jgi:hypothetical protein